jgi:hypothetical protein
MKIIDRQYCGGMGLPSLSSFMSCKAGYEAKLDPDRRCKLN